ncbi:MAG: class I tRNA ligase family protein [Candidatus Parcubacteria bacterium]|nr:class I tRNA ligase family protein [Candidatus Parcubacteria bacterium]
MADQKKFEFVDQEEKILDLWKKEDIFEKSLKQREGKEKFIFFEGPPSANGLPGLHHILARVYKDIICRYKAMNGYYTPRKAGWDTHGLPIEIQVEKELGFKNKDDIENYGVANFNSKAQELVNRYVVDWEKTTERIGYWIDNKNAYITCDPYYMESEWYLLKQIFDKGLLSQDYKVVHYCPRCGTPLSSHEVAQGYKTVVDPSVYLKFKLKGKEESLLVWTTTPWTLPSNLGVAINPDLDYKKYRLGEDIFICLNLPEDKKDQAELVGEIKGSELVGLKYEPLYDQSHMVEKSDKLYQVWPADFVSASDGTGLVHLAPYGEDDMNLAKKEGIPLLLTVDEKGNMRKEWNLPENAKNRFIKSADKEIFQDLKDRGLLISGDLKGATHEYPFCWRCDSPLVFYPLETWFIKMSMLREELVKNNETVHWVPEYIKEGRFGEWLKEVRDWALSRKRYWGTPLNIWACDDCGEKTAIGSLKELKEKAISNTNFYYLRHGQADSNVEDFASSYPEKRPNHLTIKGKKDVEESVNKIKDFKIDLIISSDLDRTKETAEIAGKILNVPVAFDERLREVDMGELNGLENEKQRHLFTSFCEKFKKNLPGGENLKEVSKRMIQAMSEAKVKYSNKNILFVSHGDPLWALKNILSGEGSSNCENRDGYPELASFGELSFVLPFNNLGELDLHRPYVDEIKLKCPKCQKTMSRVPDVVDCWFDSGAMPYSQWHYPFENKEKIEKNEAFPADYICEAIDQTRGWFYTLMAISTLLQKGAPFKNVICLGLILDEKGDKMSKSKGNIIEPSYIIDKYGVDTLRWYFFAVGSAGEAKCFSEKDLLNVQRRFLSTLYNVFVFYQTYANREATKPDEQSYRVLDRWLISDWEKIKKEVKENLEKYEINVAARLLDSFLDDFSRWYIRRSRRLFQKPQNPEELNLVSWIMNQILKEFIQVLAPFCPFVTEIIWQDLKKDNDLISIHLTDWPEIYNNNEEILLAMDQIRNIATQALALRQKAGLKLRQPLQSLNLKKKDWSWG